MKPIIHKSAKGDGLIHMQQWTPLTIIPMNQIKNQLCGTIVSSY